MQNYNRMAKKEELRVWNGPSQNPDLKCVKKQWGDLKRAVHAKQAPIHDTIEAVL